MKVMMRATVIYEWEEDSENWLDDRIESESKLVEVVQAYVENDWAYVLDCGAKETPKIEVIK